MTSVEGIIEAGMNQQPSLLVMIMALKIKHIL
jgi:hypothetical protein